MSLASPSSWWYDRLCLLLKALWCGSFSGRKVRVPWGGCSNARVQFLANPMYKSQMVMGTLIPRPCHICFVAATHETVPKAFELLPLLADALIASLKTFFSPDLPSQAPWFKDHRIEIVFIDLVMDVRADLTAEWFFNHALAIQTRETVISATALRLGYWSAFRKRSRHCAIRPWNIR